MNPILLVEDDPNDVFFVQRAMKKAGVAHLIQVVTDGQEAIDYLRGIGRFADRGKSAFPCLVLLDLKLPVVMGLDVLQWIRQEARMHVVVIVLTASREVSDVEAAYRLGANGYLVKPSEASELDDMIRCVKGFWLTHNIPPPEFAPESPMEGVVSLDHRPLAARPQTRRASAGDGSLRGNQHHRGQGPLREINERKQE